MKERQRPPRADPIVDLEVPVSVLLAERSVSLEEILELRPGKLLDFQCDPDRPLEMFVNGSCIGRGRAVDLGEKLAFLLQDVRSEPELAESPASPPAPPAGLPPDPAGMTS